MEGSNEAGKNYCAHRITGKTTTSAIIARISFIAYVTSDALDLVKLYLEQGISVRFRKKGHGIICAYCYRHGIFKTMV